MGTEDTNDQIGELNPFWLFMLFLLSKIVLCGVQKQRNKLIFGKIGSIDV